MFYSKSHELNYNKKQKLYFLTISHIILQQNPKFSQNIFTIYRENTVTIYKIFLHFKKFSILTIFS